VNCLVPRDPGIRIASQNRNYSQSFYELDFVESGARSSPLSLAWLSGAQKPLGMAGLLLVAWLALLWGQRAKNVKHVDQYSAVTLPPLSWPDSLSTRRTSLFLRHLSTSRRKRGYRYCRDIAALPVGVGRRTRMQSRGR
jgi:hypothetical protein